MRLKRLTSSGQLLSCVQLFATIHCNTPGFPVHRQLPELAQTHVHQVSDAIQPFHPLLPTSPLPALNLSQHQGLFQWARSSHQVAKVVELQFQHQFGSREKTVMSPAFKELVLQLSISHFGSRPQILPR